MIKSPYHPFQLVEEIWFDFFCFFFLVCKMDGRTEWRQMFRSSKPSAMFNCSARNWRESSPLVRTFCPELSQSIRTDWNPTNLGQFDGNAQRFHPELEVSVKNWRNGSDFSVIGINTELSRIQLHFRNHKANDIISTTTKSGRNRPKSKLRNSRQCPKRDGKIQSE